MTLGALAVAAAPALPPAASANRNVYVSNSGTNSISAFNIASSGALSPVAGSPFLGASSSPEGLAMTPDGRHLYAVNGLLGGRVSAYDVTPSGALSEVPGSPFNTGPNNPIHLGVAVTPDGRHLFVPDYNKDELIAFNIAANGALTPVAGSPFKSDFGGIGVAVTPDGSHLYVQPATRARSRPSRSRRVGR